MKVSLNKRKKFLFVKTNGPILSIKYKFSQKNLEVIKQKRNFALSLRGMDIKPLLIEKKTDDQPLI